MIYAQLSGIIKAEYILCLYAPVAQKWRERIKTLLIYGRRQKVPEAPKGIPPTKGKFLLTETCREAGLFLDCHAKETSAGSNPVRGFLKGEDFR